MNFFNMAKNMLRLTPALVIGIIPGTIEAFKKNPRKIGLYTGIATLALVGIGFLEWGRKAINEPDGKARNAPTPIPERYPEKSK